MLRLSGSFAANVLDQPDLSWTTPAPPSPVQNARAKPAPEGLIGAIVQALEASLDGAVRQSIPSLSVTVRNRR